MSDRDVKVRIAGENATKGAFDGATKAIKDLINPVNLLKSAIAGLGIATLGELFKKSVESAGDAEAAWTRVASAIEALGGHSASLRGELEKLFSQIQKTTRYSDDDAASAFAKLVTVSGDYSESVKNLSLVADVAASKQIDMSEAADLVGKVMAGTGQRGLKEFGIVAKDSADGIRQLREHLKGFAENDGATAQGRLHQIANAFDDVLEAVGRAILGGPGASGGMNAFAEALEKLAHWIDQNSAPIKQMADNLAEFVTNLRSLPDAVKHLHLPNFTAGQAVDLVKWVVGFIFGGNKDSGLNVTYQDLPGYGKPLPGAAPGKRAHELTPEEIAAAKKAKEEYDRAMREFNKAGLSGGTNYVPLQDINGGRIGPQNVQAAGLPNVGEGGASGFGADFRLTFKNATESVKGLNTELQSTGELLGTTIGGAITNFAETWSQAIDDIIQGHESLGKAILAAARKAIAGTMAAEGQATLLKAAAAAAEGLFNPAKFVQAGELLAAGSAEIAFASVLGGGGAGGGGYRGGGGSYSSGFQNSADAVAGKGRGTVVIRGTKFGWDINDADSLDNFKEMIYQLYGTREVDFVFESA